MHQNQMMIKRVMRVKKTKQHQETSSEETKSC